MDNGASSYRRFLDGDETGLAEIIKEYNDGLTFYLNSFLGDLNAADELSEDVFVKLGVKKPHFSGRSSFKTWLYAIGRNLALDHLRKASKSDSISIEDGPEPAAESDPEREYLREERKIQLHRAMRGLKPEYRQVLWLTYFEGFSTRETAEVMGKSVHNAEVLASRARQALRSVLEKEGFFNEDL